MYNFLINESAYSSMAQVSKRNPNTVEFIAILQEAGVKNRNGRIYLKEVLDSALRSPYIQERLRTKSFYLEAGHPLDENVQRQMTIDQRNIAAILKEYWWEGNILKGRLETANTAVGRDMKGLIEQGSQVAFSLRAQGNVHYDSQLQATVVDAPIQIATYDWVVNPSHDKAFLESICEDTRVSFFGQGKRILALTESTQLFEQGKMVSLNETPEPTVLDFAQHYYKKIKPLNETYLYRESDELTVNGQFAILQNQEENSTKKVVLEDYILKDIKHRITKL
jgi:hypothetical protein